MSIKDCISFYYCKFPYGKRQETLQHHLNFAYNKIPCKKNIYVACIFETPFKIKVNFEIEAKDLQEILPHVQFFFSHPIVILKNNIFTINNRNIILQYNYTIREQLDYNDQFNNFKARLILIKLELNEAH